MNFEFASRFVRAVRDRKNIVHIIIEIDRLFHRVHQNFVSRTLVTYIIGLLKVLLVMIVPG